MNYKIMQLTPFSKCFENLPEWQLQVGEYDLKLNERHYHEWSIECGNCSFYPLEIAERIIEYWKKRWTFASYQLREQ